MPLRNIRRAFKVSLILATVSLFLLAAYVIHDGFWIPQYNCEGACTGGSMLINVPNCLIPDVDLDHPSLVPFRRRVTKPMKLICSNKPPLTERRGRNLLFLEERLASYGYSRADINCFYQGILRKEQSPQHYNRHCDSNYELKHKIPINSSETLIEEEAIVVTCKDNLLGIKLYRDVHYFIQPRIVKEKISKFKEKSEALGRKPDKLNVIIMATDSVSRANMRRHMPKTFDFLKNQLNAIDLKGFNKVADNTHPNCMAMLAGLTHKDLSEIQKPKSWVDVYHDDYPFIWKEYSDEGYVTIFTEDAPRLGTFNYEKTGFLRKPTDYYTRPYFEASEDTIGHRGNGVSTMAHQCQGTRRSIKLIHNFSLEIADVLQDVPHFGIYWTSSITHDYLDLAALADQPSLDYLKAIRDRGILQNSILFFISDHGLRFGDYRKTYTGLVEERMPFVMIVLPEGFGDKYPEVHKNMLANQERVTSTFDLHATFKDILHQGYTDLKRRVPPERYGQSLFREVPLNRTCSQAGVPEKYCACQETKEIDPGDPHLAEAAKVALEGLNEGLQQFPGCAVLALDKILIGRIGEPSQGTKSKHQGTIFNSYIVTFRTKPGGALMEAHMQHHNGEYILMSEVSRINSYGKQSHCVHNFVWKKYCYCKDLL